MIVRVPASSANLGPGFDALGMALSLVLETGPIDDADAGHADLGSDADGQTRVPRPADVNHPTMVAFRLAGGDGPLWVRSPIPMGRGLGFSGAARVAGLVAAYAQRAGGDFSLMAITDELLLQATALEGHADNVAASLLGGVVAVAGGRAVRVPLAVDPAVGVWIPPTTTSTEQSRGKLPNTISRDDAVFNIGRAGLLVAALAAGDIAALRTATEDRVHQDLRFEGAQSSRRALDVALDVGAWCGWLSGSGPTVAMLCAHDRADRLVAALPAEGQAKVLRIDHEGATVTGLSR